MVKRSRRRVPRVVIAEKVIPRSKAKPKKNQVTLLGQALRSLGSLGGGAIGSLIGQAGTGSAVGNSLGATLSRWLGSGAYIVRTNTILAQGSSGIPVMHSSNQTVVVRHKEFLGDITSNTSFTINSSYTLNPGMSATFPWLSGIANQFQEYRVKGMVFHYVPTSGDAVSSTNNALGSVMIQTSYRSNDAVPSSKIEMLNEYYASDAKPSEAFCHPIECDPNENPFSIHYVRAVSVPSNDSPLMYDIGTTFVATAGMQAAGITVGELWCTYEIELRKPVISSNTTDSSLMVYRNLFTTPTTSTFFVNPSTATGNLNLTLSASSNVLSFPVGLTGTFRVNLVFAGTALTSFSMNAVTIVTNCTLSSTVYPGYWSNTTYDTGIMAGGTPTLTRGFYTVEVVMTAPSIAPTLLFPALTTSTMTYCAVTVIRSA